MKSPNAPATARPEPIAKSSLSGARRRLVELMQHLNFGRIENLEVRGGEPVFDPAPRVVRKLKIGGENCPRPEIAREDFLLKQQTLEMLDAISQLGDGEIRVIEVKHGLAFGMEIEQSLDNGGRHD